MAGTNGANGPGGAYLKLLCRPKCHSCRSRQHCADGQADRAGWPSILELNIGTPYASQAQGAVSTELDPRNVSAIVSTVRRAISLPLWVKITGQSERVPDLAAAAFAAGGDTVVMAGRSLGLIPDIETFEPMLGTTLGVGGFWNLPLTCQWLALSRAKVGADKPLIATNGAQTGLDIARMMLAGASAVQMSSPVMIRGAATLVQCIDRVSGVSEAQEPQRSRFDRCGRRPAKSFPGQTVEDRQLEEIRFRLTRWRRRLFDRSAGKRLALMQDKQKLCSEGRPCRRCCDCSDL